MGRNIKVGIDYFSFDCHPDTKLQLLEAEFGVKGLGILIKLFQKIYGEEGYYMDWTQEVELLFSMKINEGRNLVNEVVKACLKRGIFDLEKHEKYSILTSKGIQKRYLEATSKRVNVDLIEEYVVLSDDNKTIYVGRNSIYDGRNADFRSQKVHKVNKSKVNKSKEKDTKENVNDSSETLELFEIFQQEFKRPLSSTEIDKINYWIDMVGDKYIIHALRESLIVNKLSIAYIEAILVSWTNKKYTLGDLNSNKHREGYTK